MYIYTHTYIYIYLHIHITYKLYIFTCIYIERERKRESKTNVSYFKLKYENVHHFVVSAVMYIQFCNFFMYLHFSLFSILKRGKNDKSK